MRWIVEYDDSEDRVSQSEMERWAKMAPGNMGPPIDQLRFVSVEGKPVAQVEQGLGSGDAGRFQDGEGVGPKT